MVWIQEAVAVVGILLVAFVWYLFYRKELGNIRAESRRERFQVLAGRNLSSPYSVEEAKQQRSK